MQTLVALAATVLLWLAKIFTKKLSLRRKKQISSRDALRHAKKKIRAPFGKLLGYQTLVSLRKPIG